MQKISHYQRLRNKWVEKHKSLQARLWEKHHEALRWASNNFVTKQLVASSLGGLLLISAPSMPLLPKPHNFIESAQASAKKLDNNTILILDIAGKIPTEVRPLTNDEEDKVTNVLSELLKFKVSAEIEGKRLDRSYGYIGAEQHLALYPGDSIYTHFDTEEESTSFASSGMAPGLGAWGYFAHSKEVLTPKDKEREKYYIAVQTFLAADFNNKVGEYRDFFKYRKMVVVNPQNGKAIVAVVGDSGPAVWTGKHLGGSPEVMKYLERVDGSQKGPVLYFFVDDPKDQVPLGPIKI